MGDDNFPRAKSALDIGVRAGFAFPILIGREVVAVMEFFSERAIEPDEELLLTVGNIGAQLGRIVERKRALDQVQESEEHHRQILDTAHNAFVSIDSKGLIGRWNAQAEETFGWSASEALGKAIATLIIPERFRDAHFKGFAHFLEAGYFTHKNHHFYF